MAATQYVPMKHLFVFVINTFSCECAIKAIMTKITGILNLCDKHTWVSLYSCMKLLWEGADLLFYKVK